MEDGDQIEPLPTFPVRNDEPSVMDDKFASPRHSAGAPHLRLRRQNIDGAKNSLYYQCSILL